ncbi:uncharacterized protein [Temnothorax nylanderi]|uniref:uncharacterized protein n=1 Tax=Temnothorax nylanderi TaxID=102681 RepID=UPI003A8A489F
MSILFTIYREIIGYVDGIEAPRLVGTNQQYKYFKFFLNNGSNKRVQVVAWNENIEIVEEYIQANNIIHLDGVQARQPKNSRFNTGNIPFELQVQSNTICSTLGKHLCGFSSNTKPEKVKLSDVLNTSNRITLEGYIKTNFNNIHNSKLNKVIGCGSLTDGIYKLEIHIVNFDDNDYFEMDIHKGDKVEVTGIISNTNPQYLIVNTVQDLCKIEGHMSLPILLKGIKTPKKRQFEEKENENLQIQNKKTA